MASRLAEMDIDAKLSIIARLQDQVKFFPDHSTDGCDCNLCLAHDSIITAVFLIEKSMIKVVPNAQ